MPSRGHTLRIQPKDPALECIAPIMPNSGMMGLKGRLRPHAYTIDDGNPVRLTPNETETKYGASYFSSLPFSLKLAMC